MRIIGRPGRNGQTWYIPEGTLRPDTVNGKPLIRTTFTANEADWELFNQFVGEGRDLRFVNDLGEFNCSSYFRWLLVQDLERLKGVKPVNSDPVGQAAAAAASAAAAKVESSPRGRKPRLQRLATETRTET